VVKKPEQIADKISALPNTSGVYLMKDAGGRVIYVGKAVDLRKRVQSYFRKRKVISKTDFLVEKICDIEHICTDSEAEALILEAALIKEYQPNYNVELRDDKSYPYIEITDEEFPRIALVRPVERNPASLYYGPYTNPRLIREALSILRRIFMFRTCDPFPDKECLDYHMGLCGAPCIQHQDRREYAKAVRHIRMILEGKKDDLYKTLAKDMERLAARQNYEQAAKVRDQLRALGALFSGTQDINYFKEAEQLQRVLDLPRAPQRMETFDISNIMGQFSVGSMVSFFNGKPDKANYRRFKIKTVDGIDDFQMMAEVVRRRYSRLKKENRLFPDLIIVDGGKGQLSAACEELRALGIEVPIIGLAKREEEVFVPGKRQAVVLPRQSLALRLLQRCRDEAHRFAVNYHRTLRTKGMIGHMTHDTREKNDKDIR
jgi:excinuclease ABC subunit C